MAKLAAIMQLFSETKFFSILFCQTVAFQIPIQLWYFVAVDCNIFNEFDPKFCSEALLMWNMIFQATVTFVLSVRPSVRMEELSSHWTGLHEIWYLSIFPKCIEKIQVYFMADKNERHFTLRPIYMFDRPPLWSGGQSFWLQIQRSRLRFPALPDFLTSSGSGTGSTQPREVNWGTTWIKSSGSGPENRD